MSRFLFAACLLVVVSSAKAQITHNAKAKTISVSSENKKIILQIDYSAGCKITELQVNQKNVLSPTGVITSLATADANWSSDQPQQVVVHKNGNLLSVKGIKLGDVEESWQFSVTANDVVWTISRNYPQNMALEEMAMPGWHFGDLKTWKGGIFDNGGMVWCKYLSSVNDTYGVHTGGVTFWNEDQPDALRIAVRTDHDRQIAAKYSHNEKGEFTATHLLSDSELKQRHNLSRFVHRKADVFAPFDVKKGAVAVTFDLSYVNYLENYDRGNLPGIDVSAVRELLNTTGRYGVVDNGIVGANGWITNWKCLHEPFFAQIGLGVNDKNYSKNLSLTLDRERDHALLDDGRVLSRWHDVLGDEIPGTYDKETGYYEAKWGYTVDSQTGYVINTVEQFHQTGDVAWLRKHKESLESALDWLIRRDKNKNGIFEMVNNNIAEGKASDWIDIVWASFENAFVNAQMYEGLKLWAECEEILGDSKKASYYEEVAEKLKAAFNKSIDEGGFWSPEKKQYVYWRDDDGSVHGDNLVTPVNFAAIAFGICDDEQRIRTILENIEQRTVAENLFHWPLVFDSFKREEVSAGNWPFPRYENGDIFPTWGYLGIRSYVKFDKDLALKYIHNILAQYRKDGLSSQRYSRVDQQGLGTDILSGISTTVTALYSDIYGVQPKWNRFGLVPNMVSELNGTSFSYTLRDTVYEISLSVNDYKLSSNGFAVNSTIAFGISKTGNRIVYYPENKDDIKLIRGGKHTGDVNLSVERWDSEVFEWKDESEQPSEFEIHGLRSGTHYHFNINHHQENLIVGNDGILIVPAGDTESSQYRLTRRTN